VHYRHSRQAGQIAATRTGTPWSGEASINPFNSGVRPTQFSNGPAGPVDADAKTNYPIQSGMKPTAGGIVFFGDRGGTIYVLDTSNGRKLWSKKIDGAIGVVLSRI
jgi:alcohol dehydrogenase (cytochrome c)